MSYDCPKCHSILGVHGRNSEYRECPTCGWFSHISTVIDLHTETRDPEEAEQ